MTAASLARRIIDSVRSYEQRRERARRGEQEPTPIESMAQSTPAPLGETAVAGCVESATDSRERPAPVDVTTEQTPERFPGAPPPSSLCAEDNTGEI